MSPFSALLPPLVALLAGKAINEELKDLKNKTKSHTQAKKKIYISKKASQNEKAEILARNILT